MALAEGVADGKVTIDVGTHPADLEAELLAISGHRPWTSAVHSHASLGDPDAFMPTDLGIRGPLQPWAFPTMPLRSQITPSGAALAFLCALPHVVRAGHCRQQETRKSKSLK